MKTLISLVGEQPIPNLLPAKHLKPDESILLYTRTTASRAKLLQKLIPNSRLILTDAYLIEPLPLDLQQGIEGKQVIVNFTGGTKIMALAIFGMAVRSKSSLIYLQSEGHRSTLYHYRIEDGLPIYESQEEIPAVITAEEYLRAHLPGFRLEGFHRDQQGNLDSGGYFENAVHNALKDHFEILSGVRPEGVGDQIEIDLVIRDGNQVGIAEVKLGDRKEEGPKKGLDQLAMAGGREYLGTYTTKFLITARRLSKGIHELSLQRGIWIIELPEYVEGKPLAKDVAEKLVHTVKEKLSSSFQAR